MRVFVLAESFSALHPFESVHVCAWEGERLCPYVSDRDRKKKKTGGKGREGVGGRKRKREREIKDYSRARPCIKNEVGRLSLLSPYGFPVIIDPEENKLNPC